MTTGRINQVSTKNAMPSVRPTQEASVKHAGFRILTVLKTLLEVVLCESTEERRILRSRNDSTPRGQTPASQPRLNLEKLKQNGRGLPAHSIRCGGEKFVKRKNTNSQRPRPRTLLSRLGLEIKVI